MMREVCETWRGELYGLLAALTDGDAKGIEEHDGEWGTGGGGWV